VPTVEVEFSQDMATLLGWADEVATLGVRANADTRRGAARPTGARRASALVPHERMFNQMDRLHIVQEMILAESKGARVAALEKLRPIQKEDFKGIFRAMAGCRDGAPARPADARVPADGGAARAGDRPPAALPRRIASLEEMPETLSC